MRSAVALVLALASPSASAPPGRGRDTNETNPGTHMLAGFLKSPEIQVINGGSRQHAAEKNIVEIPHFSGSDKHPSAVEARQVTNNMILQWLKNAGITLEDVLRDHGLL